MSTAPKRMPNSQPGYGAVDLGAVQLAEDRPTWLHAFPVGEYHHPQHGRLRFAAYTGFRAGELAALRVRRLNLLKREVEVVEQATEVAGELVWGPPKSGEARTVRLPRFLCDEPAAYLADRPHGPEALVFTAPDGGPLRQSSFVRAYFRPAVRATGLPSGLRWHDLRHTAASLMIASGANVKAVQRQLGHASAATTLDVYAGLFPEDLDAVADRLDELHQRTAASGGADVGQAGTVQGIVAAQRP